jgi:hypothetical protein
MESCLHYNLMASLLVVVCSVSFLVVSLEHYVCMLHVVVIEFILHFYYNCSHIIIDNT